jgi:hypothetical protein
LTASPQVALVGPATIETLQVKHFHEGASTEMLAYRPLLWGQQAPAERPLRLAILGGVYRHQSNMQTLADRFLVGYPYGGEWQIPHVHVVSVYVDQLER